MYDLIYNFLIDFLGNEEIINADKQGLALFLTNIFIFFFTWVLIRFIIWIFLFFYNGAKAGKI